MALLVNRPKHPTDSRSGESQWLKEVTCDVDHTANTDVVADMSTVYEISSEQLNQLIRLRAKIRQQSRKLVLENVQDEVWQVFTVTRLDRLFEIRRI